MKTYLCLHPNLFAALLSILIQSGCSTSSHIPSVDRLEDSYYPPTHACLSEEDVQKYSFQIPNIFKELKGDPAVAIKLKNYAIYCLGDYHLGTYWMWMAAMLGDKDSARMIGKRLTKVNKEGSIPFFQGMFWLQHLDHEQGVVQETK